MITVNPEKAKAIFNEKQRAARERAFAAEHDPLIGKVLRGELSETELAVVAADIRARFPYQE